MSVKASPETIREMKSDVQNAARMLEKAGEGIAKVVSGMDQWDDRQAKEFVSIMLQVSRLTRMPVDSLKSAALKLENMAQALDEYQKVKFY